MIYGSRRVAYSFVQPRNVLHSPINEEKGISCGTLCTLYFQSEETQNFAEIITSVCKMDVILWMGLPRHLNSYLPKGFKFSSETIPRAMITEKHFNFEARVHIFQGRFSPGADKSGLSDPFVHVIVSSKFKVEKCFYCLFGSTVLAKNKKKIYRFILPVLLLHNLLAFITFFIHSFLSLF